MMNILLSFKKSRIMKRIERIQRTPINAKSFRQMMETGDKEEEAFEDLFRCMQQMPGYTEIIQIHRTSPKEIYKISSRISLAYDYMNGHYLPVALVSYGNTLDFILCNKDSILNFGISEIESVVEQAITLL